MHNRLKGKLGRAPNAADLAAARDAELAASLAASLGAEPTQAELDEARDEALRARLRLELGREPTDEEMDAARERELRERLTAKNGGRRPRQEQMEAARREAAKAKLATQLGRDPTDAELRSRGILPPQLTPAAPSDLQLFLMRPKWLPVVQPPSKTWASRRPRHLNVLSSFFHSSDVPLGFGRTS